MNFHQYNQRLSLIMNLNYSYFLYYYSYYLLKFLLYPLHLHHLTTNFLFYLLIILIPFHLFPHPPFNFSLYSNYSLIHLSTPITILDSLVILIFNFLTPSDYVITSTITLQDLQSISYSLLELYPLNFQQLDALKQLV